MQFPSDADLALTGPQQAAFAAALLDAFPSQSDLTGLVRFSLGPEVDAQLNEASRADYASSLIAWADAHDLLRLLLLGALTQNPTNQRLRAVAAAAGVAVPPLPGDPNRPLVLLLPAADVLTMESGWGDPGNCSIVLPGFLDPIRAPAAVAAWVEQNTGAATLLDQPRVPDPTTAYLRDVLRVTSNADKYWTRVDNTATVAVAVVGPPPDHVHVLVPSGGSGGPSQAYEFSPVSLDQTHPNYSQKTVFATGSYFQLEPGEFQEYEFPYSCLAPGIYQLILTLGYLYQDRRAILTRTSPDLVCPLAISTWAWAGTGAATVTYVREYTWTGGGYSEKQ